MGHEAAVVDQVVAEREEEEFEDYNVHWEGSESIYILGHRRVSLARHLSVIGVDIHIFKGYSK